MAARAVPARVPTPARQPARRFIHRHQRVLLRGFRWAGLAPAELNRFARGYVGAKLFSRATQAAQFRFVAGESEPEGPGANSSGLAIFRYRTRCGTVYGHTGNLPGYTQLFASTRDGSRSVTVSIGQQLTQHLKGDRLYAFKRLRAIEEDAVCEALS